MKFKEGAPVVTADGSQVGALSRVVIDPQTGTVIQLVVSKGFLFPSDKLIPLDWVQAAEEDRVTLKNDIPDPDVFPDFKINQFITPPSGEIDTSLTPGGNAAPLYWYPMYGAPIGMAPYYPPPIETKTIENIPQEDIALDEGAHVLSREGDHVGNIEQVLVDPDGDRVTHFVISQGVLFKHHKLIPIQWIAHLGEEAVRLNVSSRLLDGLPDYQDGY